MKKCLIVSGGDFSPVGNEYEYDFVIACDKGFANCKKMAIKPHLLIGDFDSCNTDTEIEINTVRLNPVKDDTDTMSAVKYALAAGYDHITICCALGGRFDHSLANIQTAVYIRQHNAFPLVFGSDTKIYCIKNESLKISRENNSYFSVFAYSDVCGNVCIKGAKYNLTNKKLSSSFPLGVSNEWENDQVIISVKEGVLIVVISKKD